MKKKTKKDIEEFVNHYYQTQAVLPSMKEVSHYLEISIKDMIKLMKDL